MKKIILVALLLSLNTLAQNVEKPKWNQFSEYEKSLTTYEKDTTAHAIILNEIGYAYVESGGDYNILVEHYVKIKILDQEGFDYATTKIRSHVKEKITRIKGYTTNFVDGKSVTTKLDKSNIFEKNDSEFWNSTSFTLPNIKIGSIIEYSYKKRTPFHYTFSNGWVFQSSIPAVKSSYFAKIPGFWNYNISSIGIKNPNFQQNTLVKNCINVNSTVAECLFLELTLKDIPAFIEEDFTTSNYNFLKQIKFELRTFTQADGVVIHYNKTWNDSDKRLFKEEQFGIEYNKNKYISKKLPVDLHTTSDKLERAKKVYSFIQNHFNWNDKYNLFGKFDTKKAFENKVGNLIEINLSLVNALSAVGIKTDLALLSTRQNGFPTKLYPILTDFNYLVAHIKLNGIDYFLDASQKKLPFGLLPNKCLNGNIRVYDKINGSYWHEFIPIENNEENIYAIGTIKDDATIEIQARIVSNGYAALLKRNKIRDLSIEKYEEEVDERNEDINLTDFSVENLDLIDKALIETMKFELESDFINNSTIYINPFVIQNFERNPFTLDTRNYPIDLGYKKKFQYNLAFTIPDGYKIQSIPKNRNIILAENGGKLVYLSNNTENKITIKFIFSLNKTRYRPAQYEALKEIFSQLISAQNEMIILTKE